MHSFAVRSKARELGYASTFLLPGMAIHPGCSICQGPLTLIAYIAPTLGNAAQRIYLCEACEHLEWIERAN
jgi:hypothetical protein